MSRRYGRNQKRRHRERIAELEKTQTRLLHANTRALEKAASVQEEMKLLIEAIDAICPLSAVLKPKVKPIDPGYVASGGFEYVEPGEHYAMIGVNDPIPMSVPLTRVRRKLYEILAEVQDNPLEFKRAIHLIARSPDDHRRASYFVSMEALQSAREMHHVYEHAVKVVVNKLAKAMARTRA